AAALGRVLARGVLAILLSGSCPCEAPLVGCHPKAPASAGASVMLSSHRPATGGHRCACRYVKELGSSRSPCRGLGDHFADPVLAGESPAFSVSVSALCCASMGSI